MADKTDLTFKKIVNREGTFRLRIGDYRVLYEIKWANKIIIIAKIDKRPKIYKK